jgi:predicted transcriptional regulator
MPKEAVFTIKLEPQLRDEFMAAAQAADRPASQVVREFMREFVRQQREQESYDDFLRRKVEIARAQKAAGLHYADEEVEAEAEAESRRCCARLTKPRREGSLDRGGDHRLYPY